MGRPKKNALKELKEEDIEDVVDNEPTPSNDQELKEAQEKVAELSANLENKILVDRNVGKRLSVLIEDAVRRSNDIKWRREGKMLLSELQKALSE